MFLESNAFARTVPEQGFRGFLYLEGDELTIDARAEFPRVMSEVVGFYDAMDRSGDWEPVPIVVTMSGGGAVEHDFFEHMVSEVDQFERGQEAADLLCEVWNGMQPVKVSVRLPIVPPNVSLFTDEGPFADMVALGELRINPAIANVSILGGFAFSDTSKNGLTVIVTGRGDAAAARELACELADLGWANRDRFICEGISMDDAIGRAVAAGENSALPAMVLSDLVDTPGRTSPMLHRMPFERLPRPVYPLDTGFEWTNPLAEF